MRLDVPLLFWRDGLQPGRACTWCRLILLSFYEVSYVHVSCAVDTCYKNTNTNITISNCRVEFARIKEKQSRTRRYSFELRIFLKVGTRGEPRRSQRQWPPRKANHVAVALTLNWCVPFFSGHLMCKTNSEETRSIPWSRSNDVKQYQLYLCEPCFVAGWTEINASTKTKMKYSAFNPGKLRGFAWFALFVV